MAKGFIEEAANRKVREWGRGKGSTRHKNDKQRLPICPYGCGEEGQLREIVIMEDGRALGIFNDSDGCIFQAAVELPDSPNKKKLVVGADGEMKEV